MQEMPTVSIMVCVVLGV